MAIPSLKILLKEVVEAQVKWRYILMELDVSDDDIDTIAGEHTDCLDCLAVGLKDWLRGSGRNWQEIVDALSSPTVGFKQLADNIKSKYILRQEDCRKSWAQLSALNKALLYASRNGNMVAVDNCLVSGADIECTDPNGATPLIWASGSGHKRVVFFLINNGANIKAQDKDGRSSLWAASFSGHTNIVQVLLTAGATVDLAINDEFTPIMAAAQEGHIQVVDVLLSSGADVHRCNNDGATAAHFASGKGHLEVLKKLLARGAKVDAQNKSGQTLLLAASFNGHTETVAHLLSCGAKTELADYNGFTALHMACQNGHLDTAEKLLENNANANALNNAARTPLISASYYGHPSLVRLLLSHQADPTIKDEIGLTALQFAKKQGHHNVIQLLPFEPDDQGLTAGGEKLDFEEPATKVDAATGSDPTLANLQKKTGVSDYQLDTRVTNSDLQLLAGCFDHYNNYVCALGLSEAQQLDPPRIEILERSAQSGMREALSLWIKRNPSAATFRELLTLVLSLGKSQVAQKILSYIKANIVSSK